MSTKPIATIADLDLMPDDGNRYELIDGEIIVSRSPNLLHQRVFGELFTELKLYLRANPIGEVLATLGVIFDDLNGVIPDIVFISNKRKEEIASGQRILGAPDLVIEILSPGADNARRDRVLKRQVYGKFGVNEYWIVDGENCSLEIYRNIDGIMELIVILETNDKIVSPLLPGFDLKLSSIFEPPLA